MSATPIISDYHAHIYYDANSKEAAAQLRSKIERAFTVRMGSWHDQPVGPHPKTMYQVAFETPVFGSFVPWLALNRAGLTVFIHPNTGDAVADHRDHAIWMGGHLPLKLDALG